MRVKHISISNYRAVRNLEYSCAEGMNVFVGVNGAGKSTLLYAICTLLSWFVGKVKNAEGRGVVLTDYDISKGADFCRLTLHMDTAKWVCYKQRSTVRKKAMEKSDYAELRQLTDELMTRYHNSDELMALPVVAFYGVDRAVASIPQRLHKAMSMRPLDLYDEELLGHTDFRYFFEWFRDKEDIENANYRENPNEFTPDVQLEAVRRAISSILPEYGELKVHRSPQYFSMTKGDTEYRLERFSDGEKCYITLFGDIARKLAMANPTMENPLLGEGVILIDEIDLHLHPTWQMKILRQLKETFPNCQFFITTHSPQVASSVDTSNGDNLSLVREGHIEPASSKTYGKKTDELLLKEFGMPNVRNEIVQQHIDTVWQLLEDNDYSSGAYQEEMQWLRNHLDATDPEFSHINLQVAILKKQGL